MPASIFARTAAARRAATFCTSSRVLKPSTGPLSGVGIGSSASSSPSASTTTSSSSSSSWAWRNLSPKTRRYAKMGAATCLATDAFVLLNYPEWVGLKMASE